MSPASAGLRVLPRLQQLFPRVLECREEPPILRLWAFSAGRLAWPSVLGPRLSTCQLEAGSGHDERDGIDQKVTHSKLSRR